MNIEVQNIYILYNIYNYLFVIIVKNRISMLEGHFYHNDLLHAMKLQEQRRKIYVIYNFKFNYSGNRMKDHCQDR